MANLILASASPRRLQLLEQIKITPNLIIPADIDESVQAKELPTAYAQRMSVTKATKIADKEQDAFILAADTVVACGRRVLPKAESVDTARTCLNLLSGRRHKVIGGITIIDPKGRVNTRVVQTTVALKRLSLVEIENYLDSEEWDGKAGGYAIQGLAASYIKFISGSYSNVVGLSLYDTSQMLLGMGYN